MVTQVVAAPAGDLRRSGDLGLHRTIVSDLAQGMNLQVTKVFEGSR